MDGFVATFVNRLDQKGRVSVPAPFRAVLAREGEDGLYCYPALDRPAIDGGGAKLKQAIAERLSIFETFSEDHESLATAFYGESRVLKIDTDGRVVLPEEFRAYAGIGETAVFVGQGYKFQIWEPQRFEVRQRETREHLRSVTRSLGKSSSTSFGQGGTGMTAGRGAKASAGGLARHVPVLLPEMLRYLEVVEGGRYIDGTFGAGGYTRAILERGGSVLALDRDRAAIEAGASMVTEFAGRLILVEGRFSDLDAHARAAGFFPVDGVVLDVGVSSMQIDDAARGFSFRNDGPLDMRMGPSGADAAMLVNRAPAKELAAIIRVYGEERKAGRVARAIERARAEEPITRTGRLAEIVAAAAGPAGASRIHPATRTFQALRIFINRELEELAEALAAAEAVLAEGGRLVVVAFHSLEDRIVKRFLQERAREARGSRHMPLAQSAPPTFQLAARGAVEPSAAEVEENPRARSARLRAAVRTAASARAVDFAALGVPQLQGVAGPEAYQ